jgi:RIO-like serine/threonine protein kinase
MASENGSVLVRDLVTGSVEDMECGKLLGYGAYRNVYKCADGLVAKCERSGDANARELDVWLAAQGTPAERYLAAIVAASDDETVLVQECVPQIVGKIDEDLHAQYERACQHIESEDDEQRLWNEYRKSKGKLFDMTGQFAAECGRVFRSIGFMAGDLHEGNIGIRKDGSLVVVDYGNFFPTRWMAVDQDSSGRYGGCSCSECVYIRGKYEEE